MLMTNMPLPTTHATLLNKLGQNPNDQAGGEEFVEGYGRHIYRWGRHWKLSDADAEDVTQNILVKLTQKLRAFDYDPAKSFRGWLKTVAFNAWRDFESSRRHTHVAVGGTQMEEQMLTVKARDDFLVRLNE